MLRQVGGFLHDITEILLKVPLNTINQTIKQIYIYGIKAGCYYLTGIQSGYSTGFIDASRNRGQIIS